MTELSFEFFKIGMLTFGGGNAATPIIHNRLVNEKKWIDEDEFIDIVAMANVLPGPSMIQMAAIIGLRRTNYLGSILASLMISAPSIILFVVCYNLLNQIIDPELLTNITAPVFIVIAISMGITSLNILKNNQKNISSILQMSIVFGALILMLIFDVSSIALIVITIVFSVIKAVIR